MTIEPARESVNPVEMDSIRDSGQLATPVERIKTHLERQWPRVLTLGVRLSFHISIYVDKVGNLLIKGKWQPSLFVVHEFRRMFSTR